MGRCIGVTQEGLGNAEVAMGNAQVSAAVADYGPADTLAERDGLGWEI